MSSNVIPTEAHAQLGRAERNGAVLKHMITNIMLIIRSKRPKTLSSA